MNKQISSPPNSKNVNAELKALLLEALETSYMLFKIIIPVSIIARLLDQAGATAFLGEALGPVMGIVGLPGSMGLVWATALITNIYGGVVVFATLGPAEGLTVAQITVLTTMILVAHAFPVELTIAKKSGARLRTIFSLRIISALAIGWLLNKAYVLTDYLNEPSTALWTPKNVDPSWATWAKDSALNLCYLFLIILSLLVLMKLLKKIGFTDLLTKALSPVLRTLGIGAAATPITIVGMTLGISYGGGLIIREAKSGLLTGRDIFFSLALMSICHSLIEDTLLMALLGGHVSGILWFRVAFCLLVIYLLRRLTLKMPDKLFDRFFYRAPKEKKV